jgi:hypothetical protein
VFAERLKVYDYDMSGVGDDPQTQETAKKQTLDVLDTLEKITSPHTWTSGNTELACPIVTQRTEWHVSESGDNIEFSVENPTRDARSRLQAFMDGMNLSGAYRLEERDGLLVLTVAKDNIGQAFGQFSVANLKLHDQSGT